MNKYFSQNFLIYLTLIFLLITPFSYSTNLDLDLIEGGCVGYDNALLELYYDNESRVDSSSFEVTVYDGPIRGLGVLDSFTADQTPYNIMFNEDTDYLYTISTNNDTLYTGLEGFIQIYKCESNINSNDEIIWSKNKFEFDSLLTINYYSNSTNNTSFTIENPNTQDSEYDRFVIVQNSTENIKNISIKSENNISILEDGKSEWRQFKNEYENVSLPTLVEVKVKTQLESNNSNENTTTIKKDTPLSNSTPNIETSSNQDENTSPQYFSGRNNSILYLSIIGVIIISIIIFLFVVRSKANKKKNNKNNDEAPLTLTQTKIMTYCDNYKHKYEPKEVVEQLVEQGYEKQVVIDTLWKYVEKEKKQN